MTSTVAVCTPAEASFMRDVLLDKDDDLQDVAEKVHTSLNAYPNTDPLFRQELCLLARMLFCKETLPIEQDFLEMANKYIDEDIDDEFANLFFYNHVLSMGADKNAKLHERIVGRMLAVNAYNRIAQYNYRVIQPYTRQEEAKRLASIITAFAQTCKWTRKNDLYLHQYGRMLLPADQVALLDVDGESSNPLKRLASYYAPEDLTDLLAPIIDIPPGLRATALDWKDSSSTGDFIFAVSVLQEMVDKDELHVLTGPHMSFHEYMDKTHMFVVSSNFTVAAAGFGLMDPCCMTVVDSKMPYSIALTLLEIITKRADRNSYAQLLECCEAPDRVSESNPFSQLILG